MTMNSGAGQDRKIMFMSLGVLCIIFLVVTAFVWSSVNRQNLALQDSVKALGSQIKTLKAEKDEASPSGLEKQITQLTQELRKLQGDVQLLQRKMETAEAGEKEALQQRQALETQLKEQKKALEARMKGLEEALSRTAAFHKKLVEQMEQMVRAQEKLLGGTPQ